MTEPRSLCPAYDAALNALPYREFLRQCQEAQGLDKLRFVEDPGIRQELYGLYFIAVKNNRDPKVLQAERERAREEQERENLRTAQLALQGKFGRTREERDAAKQCAEMLMPIDGRTGRRQQDPECMRQLGKSLAAIRSDYNYEPSGGYDEMGAPF